MGTVCAQTDRHSVSCIVMQRAENVPDAFFRFTLGKTSLFAVFAAESRSARFSGARNKSLHHAPHPAVVPVPYSHRHRRAKFWRPDSKSFCRFCAAAVPRDRQTGSQGISRSAHLYKLHFVSFVVRSATLKKPRNGGNFRDRMWECRTAHARSDIPHLVRASPRHPANASRHAKKFRVPLTVLELVKQKIAGPRASGVGSDFVIDDGTGKTLGMVVGVTE